MALGEVSGGHSGMGQEWALGGRGRVVCMRVWQATSSVGTSKAGWSPSAARPMYVATTAVMPRGMSVRELEAGNISSIAKTMPPIGVLKVAAMPPAAPHAMRVTRWEIEQPE